jgi:hypothetical protein
MSNVQNKLLGAADGIAQGAKDSQIENLKLKKGENYTRNGWGRRKTTLHTREEDEKLHSKRVGKMKNQTRNEWRR